MPAFADLRRQLADASAARDRAAAALFLTSQQLKRVAGELQQQRRWFDPDSRQDVAGHAALEQRQQALSATQKQQQGALARIDGELAQLQPSFWNDWTDPREHAATMSDEIPVALFPLRLETRFMTAPAGAVSQLCVRIYPDECLIDSFEEALSDTELHSAALFWREFFRAAGDAASERAAWRALVASHGSGRASWIVKQFRPRNPLSPGDPAGDPALETKPQARAPGAVILVVSVDDALTTTERTLLATYWTAAWRADRDSAGLAAARTALAAAVGGSRADALISTYAPYNLTEKPDATHTRSTATVQVAFLFLPDPGTVDTKTRSWSSPAQAKLLPERFVLLGYQDNVEVLNQLSLPVQTPFAVSLDPGGDADTQFQFDAFGNLSVGDELRWMMDFDEAVRRGLGFRVPVTSQQQASGFDRLLVLGLRLGADALQAKGELETLFQHHYFSRNGFALLPQGAATNNTEAGPSAYQRSDDADTSYDFVFKGQAEFADTDVGPDRRDGQWFAEALGLDTDWLKQVPQAGGIDQREAQAMNTALWPATLGYFMDSLMQPVFDDDAVYYTRWFFTHFVSGRGMIPAIRIGRQPYGILATSAFTKATWMSDDRRGASIPVAGRESRSAGFATWLIRFKGILDQLRVIWSGLATQVEQVGGAVADPHQALLDIVGLHPASVEFHQRYANTKDQEHNIGLIWQLFVSWQTLPANELHDEALQRLRQFGYAGAALPPLLDLFWKVTANKLDGALIQDGALSETDGLRKVTTDAHNYIEWLHEWASVSFDTVRVQDGFIAGQAPNALLYLLLKHALELGYHDAGVRTLDDARLLDPTGPQTLRAEPHFFQIASATSTADTPAIAAAKSRYELLYQPEARVTGDSRLPLVDFITRTIGSLYSTRYLSEQLDALDALSTAPTARLERTFAEHLDCCTYRLDAWIEGLVQYQLQSMRAHADPDAVNADGGPANGNGQGASHRRGIYLGAYGWLENVRPRTSALASVGLRGELDTIFNRQQPAGQSGPLMSDPDNEGYIHAPSVNHAVTASVLRSGYLANATPAQPDLLKVDLSSQRVRLAMGMIEGIRNGQSLAALLGYQFERGLHDRQALAESDQFIYPLRLVFPLYTQPATTLPEGATIESVEARNVVNGLSLLRHVKDAAPADKAYPFDLATQLPPATTAQQTAIGAEIDRLLDVYDALCDLAVAEGVYQVVMGNYDRAAATLDAYGQATFPPIPDVVRTPRSGIALTHRIALHIEADAVVNAGDNPRARAEPGLDRWLTGLLPPAASIGCTVTYTDAASGAGQATVVTQADLDLQPIDLLFALSPDNLQARSELEDRVRDAVLRRAGLNVRPDLLTSVAYLKAGPGQFSFFEVASLVRSARALLLRSRTLRATDAGLPTDAGIGDPSTVTLARSRVDFLPVALTTLRDSRLVPLQTQLDTALPESGPIVATVVADIDGYLDNIVAACRELAMYGLAQTGFGVFLEAKAALFAKVTAQAAATALRLQGRLDAYHALLLTLPTTVGEPDRLALLLKAERQVSTDFTDPAGKTSAQLLAIVQGKATAFDGQRAAFAAFATTTATTVTGLMASFQALLPGLPAFDLEPVTTDEVTAQMVAQATDIQIRVSQLVATLDTKIAAVNQGLVDHDAAADSETRIKILTDAARLVFGDEFVLVPSFDVPAQQGQEWGNAYADRGSLLNYQKSSLDRDFPVDDWMHGVARVREKVHHLEHLFFVADALATQAPDLDPIQFPYSANASWMAVEYPAAASSLLENEMLLYTAHYAQPFAAGRAQGGLLLDEWTEVVPAETHTTGLAFHFDKPNAEPPQAILLVTPPQFKGAWQWQDLVAALHETLDMARLRAVEPQQLDQTSLAVFLPATIMATTWQPVTIGVDLALVNKFTDRIA